MFLRVHHVISSTVLRLYSVRCENYILLRKCRLEQRPHLVIDYVPRYLTRYLTRYVTRYLTRYLTRNLPVLDALLAVKLGSNSKYQIIGRNGLCFPFYK